jgi:hypothetical protein
MPPEDTVSDTNTRESIADEVRSLYASARVRAETELAFQKARAGLVGKWAGVAAALGCAAVALLFLAAMGAVFGLVLSLAAVLGPWAATGIVVGAFVLLAGVAAMLAWSRVRRIMALLRGGDA